MFVNLDAGEHASETIALWSCADVLNCACGGHAGDPSSMRRVAAFCVTGDGRSVGLGAHPSYPDRASFGRTSLPMSANEVAASVESQCGVLVRLAHEAGATVGWMKPHGALYHDASKSQHLAAAVVRAAIAALGRQVVVIGPPRGELATAAQHAGLQYAREGFADRRMRADGSLVPRTEPGALIADPDEAGRQARVLARQVDTIGVHADTPGALEILKAVRDAIRV